MDDKRPFSDQLMEAAGRVEDLSHDELARLLYKAAVRLRAVHVVGVRLEHVPVPAYHLLRHLAQGPVPLGSLGSRDMDTAVAFLVSRGLAEADTDARHLAITPAGREIGEIADERGGQDAQEDRQ